MRVLAKLNKLTEFDPEAVPAAVELFQKLNVDKFFSKIDLGKGHCRVTIPEDGLGYPRRLLQVSDDVFGHIEFCCYTEEIEHLQIPESCLDT